MSYAEYLSINGGMATTGGHLGVMVGTEIAACPRGWIFVPLGSSVETVEEALAASKAGRKAWPKRINANTMDEEAAI